MEKIAQENIQIFRITLFNYEIQTSYFTENWPSRAHRLWPSFYCYYIFCDCYAFVGLHLDDDYGYYSLARLLSVRPAALISTILDCRPFIVSVRDVIWAKGGPASGHGSVAIQYLFFCSIAYPFMDHDLVLWPLASLFLLLERRVCVYRWACVYPDDVCVHCFSFIS